MAFTPNTLTCLTPYAGTGPKIWFYTHTDALNTVDTAAYFSAAFAMGMRANDLVFYNKTDTFVWAMAAVNAASSSAVDLGDFTTVGTATDTR